MKSHIINFRQLTAKGETPPRHTDSMAGLFEAWLMVIPPQKRKSTHRR
jgi:hypothetical protein